MLFRAEKREKTSSELSSMLYSLHIRGGGKLAGLGCWDCDVGGDHTFRFKVPTSNPSSISRASSLWPTSSKASVASCPPTSSRTSSPPLNEVR